MRICLTVYKNIWIHNYFWLYQVLMIYYGMVILIREARMATNYDVMQNKKCKLVREIIKNKNSSLMKW